MTVLAQILSTESLRTNRKPTDADEHESTLRKYLETYKKLVVDLHRLFLSKRKTKICLFAEDVDKTYHLNEHINGVFHLAANLSTDGGALLNEFFDPEVTGEVFQLRKELDNDVEMGSDDIESRPGSVCKETFRQLVLNRIKYPFVVRCLLGTYVTKECRCCCCQAQCYCLKIHGRTCWTCLTKSFPISESEYTHLRLDALTSCPCFTDGIKLCIGCKTGCYCRLVYAFPCADCVKWEAQHKLYKRILYTEKAISEGKTTLETSFVPLKRVGQISADEFQRRNYGMKCDCGDGSCGPCQRGCYCIYFGAKCVRCQKNPGCIYFGTKCVRHFHKEGDRKSVV